MNRFRSVPIDQLTTVAAEDVSEEHRRLAQELLDRGDLPLIRVLRRPEGGFELVDGERRLRAHQVVGDRSVPVLILGISD